MHGDVVIQARGLGKKYLIGHEAQREPYTALRDVVAGGIRRLARGARDLVRGRRESTGVEIEEFWALRDVDFEVRRGEVVGIIGRNGAGKSTLLKVLSRITEPSAGRVELRGRVASLLEVGTGFHLELSGRENIFLNGAILGMKRSEIARKFDEIVAFAEVERFIDTPVKRYSSGMYMRLAFSVAAHLEPEILVVDEVLAVGDAEFQRKCLGKMQNVAGEGRTVLFVSHNMSAIEQLCGRGLWLRSGQLRRDGEVRSVVSEYFSEMGEEVLEYRPPGNPERRVEIRSISLMGANGQAVQHVTTADTPTLVLELEIRQRAPGLKIAFALHDAIENPIFASCPPDSDIEYPTSPGIHRLKATFPTAVLMPQRYSVTVSAYSETTGALHNCAHALVFDVVPAKTKVYSTEPNRLGVLQVLCRWEHEVLK
jgi:lipopolysaccharide transport system ATP-binding protein